MLFKVNVRGGRSRERSITYPVGNKESVSLSFATSFTIMSVNFKIKSDIKRRENFSLEIKFVGRKLS